MFTKNEISHQWQWVGNELRYISRQNIETIMISPFNNFRMLFAMSVYRFFMHTSSSQR